jgi:hypothetical protein
MVCELTKGFLRVEWKEAQCVKFANFFGKNIFPWLVFSYQHVTVIDILGLSNTPTCTEVRCPRHVSGILDDYYNCMFIPVHQHWLKLFVN